MRVTITGLCLVGLTLWGGCAAEVHPALVVQKMNGFLLDLPGAEGCDSGVLVAHQRWVILTIADPLYDAGPVSRLDRPYVDSVDVEHFLSATQLSFRFRTEIQSASLVPPGPDGRLRVSVFVPPAQPSP